MSEKVNGCTVAPGGEHCLHSHPGVWGEDKTPVCCWCGKDVRLHGEFLPVYPNPWWSWTNVTGGGTSQMPNTWYNAPLQGANTLTGNANGDTFTVNLYPSGSAGTGG